MYNKFLIAVSQAGDTKISKLSQAFSDIDSVLPEINSHLQIEGTNLVIFRANKNDGTYDISCRYIPGIDIYNNVILKQTDLGTLDTNNLKELKLGKLIIDVGKIRHHVVETEDNILGQIEVMGYLDSSLTKEESKYATDLLYYIRKYLASALKGKYVISYIDPFDVSKEIYQKDSKWTHTQYDEGIFDLISQIQERVRNAFLEHVRDSLLFYNICSNRGYLNYAEVINREYSKVSDMYFESNDFKKNIETYIYKLKNDPDIVSNVDSVIAKYSFDSITHTYIESIRKGYDFSTTRENEYSVVSFQFNEEMKKQVTKYINTIFNDLFNSDKKVANLYNIFSQRIITAVNRDELDETKYDTEGKRKQEEVIEKLPDSVRELISEDDLSSSDSNSIQEQQDKSLSDSSKQKQTYYTEDAKPSNPNLSETNVESDDTMTLQDAAKEYASLLGYTIEFDNKGDIKVRNKNNIIVDSGSFIDEVKQHFKDKIQEGKDAPDFQGEKVSTPTIYDSMLKPNSYSQFHTRAGAILDVLDNIQSYVSKFDEELSPANMLEIKKYVANAKELPQGIRNSLLSPLQTSESISTAFQYFKAVLVCQIEILEIFNEEDDYATAKQRIRAILNEHRDLAKYFKSKLVLDLPDKSVNEFVQDTKNTPYLLAKQFRKYLSKLGWKLDQAGSYFYKLNSKGNRIKLSDDKLKKYLNDFNETNNSDLKLEDVFVQRNFNIEPVELIFEDDEFTHFLLNNVNHGISNINKTLNEIANEINSL